MADRITANLPSRDFDVTVGFYVRFGFEVEYRDDGWLILSCGDMEVEFFAHPDLDPRASWFSACVRVDDLDGFFERCMTAGLPADSDAIPRITGIVTQSPAPRMFAVIDPDGSLLRVLDNRD